MPAVGSNSLRAKLSETWKFWSKFWAKHDGAWKRPLSVFVKHNGSWVKVWDEKPELVSTSTYYQDIMGQFNRAWKVVTIKNNGFAATVTASVTDFFQPNPEVDVTPVSIAIDDTVQVSAYAQYIGNYQGSFPSITITNASGSITV